MKTDAVGVDLKREKKKMTTMLATGWLERHKKRIGQQGNITASKITLQTSMYYKKRNVNHTWVKLNKQHHLVRWMMETMIKS